jgi:hypothetical protein
MVSGLPYATLVDERVQQPRPDAAPAMARRDMDAFDLGNTWFELAQGSGADRQSALRGEQDARVPGPACGDPATYLLTVGRDDGSTGKRQQLWIRLYHVGVEQAYESLVVGWACHTDRDGWIVGSHVAMMPEPGSGLGPRRGSLCRR